LSRDAHTKDLEGMFSKYGKLTRCDIKGSFAFVTYEDERDAADALKETNGKDLAGSKINVEWAKGNSRYEGGGGDRGGDRGDRRRSEACYECGEKGHFARDCRNRRDNSRSYQKSSYRERSRSRSPRKRRSRSRSRSPRKRKSHSKSPKRHRSASPEKKRRRSRSKSPDRSRDDKQERDRKRSRSKSPERRRSRSPTHRSKRSRSKSPRRDDKREDRRKRSRSPTKKDSKDKSEQKKDVGPKPTKEEIKSKEQLLADLDPNSEEYMMAQMGFPVGFDSTKGKKVEGADVSAAKVIPKRQYRQYMNKRGGFGRPLENANVG